MNKLLGASWRTTLTGTLGVAAAVGAAAGLLLHGNYNFNSPEWLAVMAAFSTAIGNLNSRDNKVTSEQAGAK